MSLGEYWYFIGRYRHPNFGSFSLHPRKAISCGEGGVLITNEETLDSEIKLLRNHGTEITNGKMDFTRFGFNYRMTDFQAALVFSQLPRLNETINYKQNLAEVYFSELKTTKIKLPFVPNYTKHTWQTFHVLVNENINYRKFYH